MQRIDEAIMLTLGITEDNNVADLERIKQLEEQLAKEKETSDRILRSSEKRQKDTMNWSVRKDMGMIKSISER